MHFKVEYLQDQLQTMASETLVYVSFFKESPAKILEESMKILRYGFMRNKLKQSLNVIILIMERFFHCNTTLPLGWCKRKCVTLIMIYIKCCVQSKET